MKNRRRSSFLMIATVVICGLVAGPIPASAATIVNVAEVRSTPPVTNERVGGSVAVSSDGALALVGANSRGDVTIAGRVKVYTSTGPGAAWTALPDIRPDDGGVISDRFGYSLALSSDGSTAVIAAVLSASPIPDGPGMVYVFSRTATGWTQEQLIAAPSGMGSSFGEAIDISSDGRNFVVGAPCAEGSICNGAAYFFSKPIGATSWALNTTTTCAAATGGLCGAAVAISGDGTVAAVGQPYYKTVSGSTTTVRPYVHTFQRAGTATTWSYQAALASPDGDNALTSFGYGDSLALTESGSILVASASGLTVVNGTYVAGGVYTYRFTGTSWGTPSLVVRSASSGSPLRKLGYSVDVSADGLAMVAGAPGGSTTTAAGGGVAYRWTRTSVTAAWTFTDTFTSAGIASGDSFGSSIAIPAASSYPVIGAPFKPSSSTTGAGAAYLY
jgi:hypothetical protein